ncbi:MAG TPA: hypothetical protein VLG49_00355 [Rhabdochlamydiaceae bacterium]|nr:hypothetical protein [Rhabdochlamydiaceae bacterium]
MTILSKARKFFIFFTIYLASYRCFLFSVEFDDLTYDFLLSNPYTDHVQHFQKLFQQTKITSFLEFGIGYGTKYFLDHCQKVTSCEIIFQNQTSLWFYHSVDLFQRCSNWKPILMHGGTALQNANEFCIHNHKDPALYEPAYLLDLKSICNELFKDNQFDVAFVDPGFHMRGDLVNELFDRVPIIVAHDTNYVPELYGWNKIQMPSNYKKVVFTEGQGITFWIQNNRPELIAELSKRN